MAIDANLSVRSKRRIDAPRDTSRKAQTSPRAVFCLIDAEPALVFIGAFSSPGPVPTSRENANVIPVP